jgi:hypothetical protein
MKSLEHNGRPMYQISRCFIASNLGAIGDLNMWTSKWCIAIMEQQRPLLSEILRPV